MFLFFFLAILMTSSAKKCSQIFKGGKVTIHSDEGQKLETNYGG